MKYKFKCSVDLGSFCGGGGCDYEDYFTVELSDNDVEAIRNSKIDWNNSENVMSDIGRLLPDIRHKILIGAWGVVNYAAVRDCRISGLWQDAQDNEDIEVDEDELMEYDIEYRGFNPVDKDGNRLPYAKAYSLWVEWEEEQLANLSFKDRTQFYMKRYNLTEVNTEDTDFEIEFPDSLKQL